MRSIAKKSTLLYFYFGLFALLFLAGCAIKDADEQPYNLSAKQWYALIIDELKKHDLAKADTHYSGFASEHVADPLLEPIIIILAQQHMAEEEYRLADFYLDEYNKKFGNSQNADYTRFLKIKAKFDSFAVPNRNQDLMLKSQKEIATFLADYPHTPYAPLVESMLNGFNLGIFYLDETTLDLYRRTGREDSAAIYEARIKASPFFNAPIIKPITPWYRRIFEAF